MQPADGPAELALILDMVAGREGQSLTDPYFGDAAGFEETWADVLAAARALVSRITEQS